MSDWDQRRRRSRSRSPPNRFYRPSSRDRADWTRGGRGGGRSPSPPPRGRWQGDDAGRWDDRGRGGSRDRSRDRGGPSQDRGGGDGDRFAQRRSPVRYERDWADRDREDAGYQQQQRGYGEGYARQQQPRGGYDRPRGEDFDRGENHHKDGYDAGNDGAGRRDNAAGTQQGYVNREYANQDDRRQQQQHRRRRPGDDEGRPSRVFKPDWMCPRGCGVVFGSKSNCFKCGSPRETGVDEVPADVIYGGVVAGKYDWVCNVLGCRSVNFARRSVCFTCLVPKGPLATKVDQSDRTGAGKGPGDLLANRFDPARARQASDAAAAAAWGAAAAAGQQHVDATANAAWAPKEFNETADAATAGLPGHDQTAMEPAAADSGLVAHQAQQQYAQQQYAQQPGSVAKDPHAASKKKRRKEPALPGAIEDAAGGAAAVAALEQSGYVYDPDTGYYRDEASGMWYDANSGLSYHAESAAWYKWNAETNAYEPATSGAATSGAAAQQPQQGAAKKPRVAATIGSTAKLDTVAIKKHQVAKLAAAELETMESAYRDRAAERRSRHGESAAAAAAATGPVKGKVYGGKIRTPGVPGYAPGSAPQSGSGGAGEGEDSYKASVQRVALERFKAAMKE